MLKLLLQTKIVKMNDQSFVVAAKIGSSKNKTKPQT